MTTTTHTYEPWGVCRDLFECRHPEVLISGPAGTGKSRACLEKLHAMALANPGFRGLMVRKTLTSLTATGIVTYKQFVAPETIQAGVVEWYGGSSAEPAAWRYSNGSRITVGGMDKATRIMSSEYDAVYVQEATELTETDWESITTRLRSSALSFTQLMADCNPDTHTHWLKRRCDRGDTIYLRSRHEDNPTLYSRDGELTEHGTAYMARLDKLTGTRKARLRYGEWTSAEGIVFPEYDSGIHVIDPHPIPADWQRWWVLDFGFVNPFVCQHFAEKPDGELVLYREWYGPGRLVAEWAEAILAVVAPNGREWIEPRPIAVICDHDAEGRETFARTIGQQTVAAHKAVSDGIQAVQQRLKDQRLYFMRDCLQHPPDQSLSDASKPVRTTDEFGGYVWADSKVKEQPVKADDHGMDAIRYMVAAQDLGHRPGVRFM